MYTDLSGTVSGILGLQEMYSQTTALVSEGIIANIPSLNLTGKSDSYALDSQWLELR